MDKLMRWRRMENGDCRLEVKTDRGWVLASMTQHWKSNPDHVKWMSPDMTCMRSLLAQGYQLVKEDGTVVESSPPVPRTDNSLARSFARVAQIQELKEQVGLDELKSELAHADSINEFRAIAILSIGRLEQLLDVTLRLLEMNSSQREFLIEAMEGGEPMVRMEVVFPGEEISQ